MFSAVVTRSRDVGAARPACEKIAAGEIGRFRRRERGMQRPRDFSVKPLMFFLSSMIKSAVSVAIYDHCHVKSITNVAQYIKNARITANRFGTDRLTAVILNHSVAILLLMKAVTMALFSTVLADPV